MNLAAQKRRLESELAEALRFASACEWKHPAVIDVGDDLDHVVSSEDQAEQVRRLERYTRQVRQCQDALQRIREGVYGVCVSCLEPIGEARLKALPWASECRKCREVEEQQREMEVARG